MVNGPNSLGNGVIDTGVTHHVTIGEIHNDEIVLLGIDGTNELVLHFISRHLRLQVVSCHLWRGNQDTVFPIERLFTTPIKEECNVSIFLRLCSVKLLFTQLRKIFAEGILHVLLGEENIDTRERSIVRRHAIIFQCRNSLHAFLGHILLSEHRSEFLRTVVAEINKDDHITLFDNTVYL